jgi:DNA invertase Pin-like site-specific DNA recombinase
MTETHPEKRVIGYARVSTYGQTLDSQLEQLRKAGCSSRNIYREKVTGARADRRELNKMLGKLSPGDVVTVTRIDRLARSTFDLFGIVKRIVDAKAQFRSLAEPWANSASSTGRLDARPYSEASPTWSAILSAPAPPRAGAAPRPKESTWADPLP